MVGVCNEDEGLIRQWACQGLYRIHFFLYLFESLGPFLIPLPWILLLDVLADGAKIPGKPCHMLSVTSDGSQKKVCRRAFKSCAGGFRSGHPIWRYWGPTTLHQCQTQDAPICTEGICSCSPSNGNCIVAMCQLMLPITLTLRTGSCSYKNVVNVGLQHGSFFFDQHLHALFLQHFSDDLVYCPLE